MTDSQLSDIHTVADVRAYNEDNGDAQGRDAVSFLTTDVPALWARIKPALNVDGIHAIVMDSKSDHLPIGRERPRTALRLLMALLTFRRPSDVYTCVEDLPMLDTDEKYQSLIRKLPFVDETDRAAIAADEAERERLEEFATNSVEVIVYDQIWGRNTQLRPALAKLHLI